MTEDKNLEEMIRTSLESIRTMVDANTVVGKPIETPAGTTIIPISKISLGHTSGGVQFDGKQVVAKNFAGGGGTGLSINPICFLSIDAEGKVELIPLGEGKNDTADTVADLIEKAPDLFSKLKNLFKNKKKKKRSDAEADEDDAAEEETQETDAKEEE